MLSRTEDKLILQESVFPLISEEHRFATLNDFKFLKSPFRTSQVGSVGIDCDVHVTPTALIPEIIKGKYGSYVSPEDFQNDRTFYTMLLTMNGKVSECTSYMIQHLKFIFNIGDNNTKIISFEPTGEGINAKIEKNGSRKFNFSLDGKIGASLEHSSDNKNNQTTLSVGPDLSTSVGYDNERGWNVTFEKVISEVKGYTEKNSTSGLQELFYEMFRNETIVAPNERLGETVVVFATIIFSVPKKFSNIGIKYNATGSVKKLKIIAPNGFISGSGEISNILPNPTEN